MFIWICLHFSIRWRPPLLHIISWLCPWCQVTQWVTAEQLPTVASEKACDTCSQELKKEWAHTEGDSATLLCCLLWNRHILISPTALYCKRISRLFTWAKWKKQPQLIQTQGISVCTFLQSHARWDLQFHSLMSENLKEHETAESLFIFPVKEYREQVGRRRLLEASYTFLFQTEHCYPGAGDLRIKHRQWIFFIFFTFFLILIQQNEEIISVIASCTAYTLLHFTEFA